MDFVETKFSSINTLERSVNLERKFWCLQFFQRMNLKILIFDLAFWGRNYWLVFGKNWKHLSSEIIWPLARHKLSAPKNLEEVRPKKSNSFLILQDLDQKSWKIPSAHSISSFPVGTFMRSRRQKNSLQEFQSKKQPTSPSYS